MDTPIKLSIIVPFYNVEKYIEQCIRSLYNQDLPLEEYEVICVDDCSPDGSRAIVERLMKEFPNIRLICHERNKKLGGARNTGLKAATGEYVLFLDSDDYYKQNILGVLLQEIEVYKDDYVCFDFANLCPNGSILELNTFKRTKVMNGREMLFCKDIPWVYQISACNKIYRRSFLLENALFFEEYIMFEDNDFTLRLTSVAEKCHHMMFTPYVYRMNPDSITHSRIETSILMYWQTIWQHILRIRPSLIAVDLRYDALINEYIKSDMYELLNNLGKLSCKEKKMVKQNFSILTWYKVIRLLPFKSRLVYIVKLIKA